MHGEPHVGEAFLSVDAERVACRRRRAALSTMVIQLSAAASSSPTRFLDRNRLDGDERRIVALNHEVSTTTPYTTPGAPEPHDRLVDAGLTPTSRLPAVVHLTLMPECGRPVLGGRVLSRFWTSANRSSLVQTTAPPRFRSARSGIEVKCGREAVGAGRGRVGRRHNDPNADPRRRRAHEVSRLLIPLRPKRRSREGHEGSGETST